MQDDRLSGKHVIVTGAAKGIGRGIAVRIARAGATVTIFDTDVESAEETADRVRAQGSEVAIRAVDVTDDQRIRGSLSAATEEFGSIHGLVNNAGVQQSVPILETTEVQWDRHLDVNAKGVFLVSKAVAERMIEQKTEGSIVNIASVGAVRPFAGQGAYAASKAAVQAFTVVLAKELATNGITVNSINPGTVDTPMVENWLAENADQQSRDPADVLVDAVDKHLLDRIGDPEEIGHVVTLLLSEEGDWITGEAINVDGGFTVG